MKQFQRILVCAIIALFVAACGDAVDRTEPPLEPTMPSSPQNVQVTPGNSQITLSWNTVNDATSYNIYWNDSGDSDGVTNFETSPFIHTGRSNGMEYSYIVTAVNAIGESAPSNKVSAISGVYTVYYVSSTAPDGGNGTSPGEAKQTITAAIGVAAAGDLPAIVQINAGTYNVNSDTTGTPTHVVLSEGISLYGGYNAKFSYRDPAAYITTITDDSTAIGGFLSPNSALEAGAGISIATIIDGFVLNGSTQAGAHYTAAVWTHDGGSPTVRNNTLNGGSGGYSFGMYNNNSSPTVRNNTLNGGSGDSSYGMRNSFSSSPIVQNNTLNGGSGSGASFGMHNDSSSPTVQNNTLNGGSGGNSYGMHNFYSSSPIVQNNTLNGGSGSNSFGMRNYSSSPIVRNNTLNGGSGSAGSTGMSNYDTSYPAVVQNNTINGGSGGTTSYGMINYNSSPTVQNNTINGGSSYMNSYGMVNASSSPAIDNNIIFTSGAGAAYCIYESDAGSDPASLRNNDLFVCTTVYRDSDAGCTGDGDDDGDATTCTLAEMQALTDFGPLGVSGNVSADPVFADIDGPDNDIDTMDDNDWHFGALSPSSVTTGGLNGEDGGWGFTTDKDGVTRPGTGLDWSMGAYEP